MTTLDLYDTDTPRHGNPVVLAGLKRLWASFKRTRAERKMVMTLNQLDDHLLRDIGIEPQDMIAALHGRRAPSIFFHPMRRKLDHE